VYVYCKFFKNRKLKMFKKVKILRKGGMVS
jgi:hypothetical protein